MKQWKLISLFLIEAIIMLYAVPKANEDEISMQDRLLFDLSLALLISLAILIRENRGERKSIAKLLLVCVATYLQIVYSSAFYEWGGGICLILPILQIIFGYTIFKLSHNVVSLIVGCSNLLFSTIWANQMFGILWFHNRSSDLETMAVASLYAGVGALLVVVISSIMIMKFNPKDLKSYETDR